MNSAISRIFQVKLQCVKIKKERIITKHLHMQTKDIATIGWYMLHIDTKKKNDSRSVLSS